MKFDINSLEKGCLQNYETRRFGRSKLMSLSALLRLELGDPGGLELEHLKEDNTDPEDVKEAQMLAGTIIWLSTRTRPDLAYVQHRISSLAVRAPKKALAEGTRLLRYIKRHRKLCSGMEQIRIRRDYSLW